MALRKCNGVDLCGLLVDVGGCCWWMLLVGTILELSVLDAIAGCYRWMLLVDAIGRDNSRIVRTGCYCWMLLVGTILELSVRDLLAVIGKDASHHAMQDWGDGDFESAIGAAGYMGLKGLAIFLIGEGARAEIFVSKLVFDTC
jgi:hypothetical protein